MMRLLAVLMLAAAIALAGCKCCDDKKAEQAPPPAQGGTAMEVEEDESGGKETPVALDKLPEVVRNAALAAVPGLDILASSMEEEDGKTYYEVSGKAGGQAYEVILTPEGEVVVVEKIVDVASVPEAVRKAAMDKVPGIAFYMAEEIKKGSATQYELKGKVGAKRYELKLSEAGEVLEIED